MQTRRRRADRRAVTMWYVVLVYLQADMCEWLAYKLSRHARRTLRRSWLASSPVAGRNLSNTQHAEQNTTATTHITAHHSTSHDIT